MTNNKVLIDALKEAKGALERSYDMTEYPATDDCCAAKAIRTIEAALASYAEQAPREITIPDDQNEQTWRDFFNVISKEMSFVDLSESDFSEILFPLLSQDYTLKRRSEGQVTGKSAGPIPTPFEVFIDSKAKQAWSNIQAKTAKYQNQLIAECLQGEAGKLPEQQPADTTRIYELSTLVYRLIRMLDKKECTQKEGEDIENARRYLAKNFNPSDVLHAQTEVSGEQKGE